MKHNTLTLSPRERSRDIDNLARLKLEDLERLTETGPVLWPGPIVVTEEAFANLTPEHVWSAVALHECGVWGACGTRQKIENDQALTVGGAAQSRWFVGESFQFTVETKLQAGEEQTTIAVCAGSTPLCARRPSPVRLGDVLLDDSVYCVPHEHVWFALRGHEMGSSGDCDVFAAKPLLSTAVSWWTFPVEDPMRSQPFWVLTHLAKPPVTVVFAGGEPVSRL